MAWLSGWWSIVDGWWLNVDDWGNSKVGWEVMGGVESGVVVAGVDCSSGVIPLSSVVVGR